MKGVLHTLTAIWGLSLSAFAQQEPRGVLIYQEPPSSYTQAIEYRSFRKDSALYSTIVYPNGQHKQLKTQGVIAILDYPPFTFDESLPDTAHFFVNKIQEIERQFPRLQHQMEVVRGKWERALSVYQQTYKPSPAGGQKVEAVPVLDLKRTQYRNARLISTTYDSATIAHETGVARIPITELNLPQIVSLNITSITTQLGTSALEEEENASSRLGQKSFTNKLRRTGMGTLAFIQTRTGLRSDMLSIWLLFAIFPSLILALLAANLMQARKRNSFRPKPTSRL